MDARWQRPVWQVGGRSAQLRNDVTNVKGRLDLNAGGHEI
jgi:hypothetical protein